MKRLILAALLFATPATAATEWMYLLTDKDKTKYYIDRAGFEAGHPASRAAKIWVKLDSRADTTVSWNELRTLYLIDCPAQTYRAVTHTAFYPDGKNRSFPGDGKLTHVVPDTNFSAIADAVCMAPNQGANTSRRVTI